MDYQPAQLGQLRLECSRRWRSPSQATLATGACRARRRAPFSTHLEWRSPISRQPLESPIEFAEIERYGIRRQVHVALEPFSPLLGQARGPSPPRTQYRAGAALAPYCSHVLGDQRDRRADVAQHQRVTQPQHCVVVTLQPPVTALIRALAQPAAIAAVTSLTSSRPN